MEITILGSGTGTPALQRKASGLLLRIENKNILFDSGPGTINRLLELGITYHDIDDIFYTHFHTDHTLDLAVVLFAAKYALSLRTKRLSIFGAVGLKKFYNGLIDLYGDVLRPDIYVVCLQELEQQTLDFNGYKITTLPMRHTPESLGYRIESKGRTVACSGDTDSCDNLVKLGQNVDILILDCSFPDGMKAAGHLTPTEAAKTAQACGCKKLVLTHLYPVCRSRDILKQAQGVFKGEIIVAEDLMTLNP